MDTEPEAPAPRKSLMNLPLPTDNLWKFLAICGTVIMLACIIMPFAIFYQDSALRHKFAVDTMICRPAYEPQPPQNAPPPKDGLTRIDQIGNNDAAASQKSVQDFTDKLSDEGRAAVRKALGMPQPVVHTRDEDLQQIVEDMRVVVEARLKIYDTTGSHWMTMADGAVFWLRIGAIISGAVALFGFWGWWYFLQRHNDKAVRAEAEKAVRAAASPILKA